MPDFSELFFESKAQPIQYNGKIVVLSDQYPVADGDILVASIVRTSSDCLQGLSIDITGSCVMDGEHVKRGKGVRMLFWEDTAPKEIKLQVKTKKDFVWVENIWESIDHRGIRGTDSRRFGAAMLVEEIENGRRYRCNDWHPDEDFDDIIFTIRTQKREK